MAKRSSLSEVGIDVAVGREKAPARPDPETPFRIVIFGDFSGRANRSRSEPLAGRRAVMVDRDNFEEVLGKAGAGLKLSLSSGSDFTLRFIELDDFHPDRIFEREELFRELREARGKLADTQTFRAAAHEMGILPAGAAASGAATPAPTPRPPAPPDAESLVSGSLLDQMIEQTETRSSEGRPSRAPDELMTFVKRVVEPYLVLGTDPRQAEVVARVDRAIGDAMRALLHYRDFQSLEAAWHAVDFLVRRLETSPQLKLYLVDVSKTELAADLLSSDDLHSTGIYELLVEKTVGTPGAEPWSVLVGNYTFEPTLDDVELLRRLAMIGAAARAPFLSAADSEFLGCKSLAASPDARDWHPDNSSEGIQAWRLFRRLPEARWAGLGLPRFLLRLPYGRETNPTEQFDFEEMPRTPAHDGYLWGNPAFAAALLLARAFSDDGWEMRPGTHPEVDGLPLHVFKQDGESAVKPCAEVLLTEEAAEQMLEAGLMPLVSLKDRDAVRLIRFQSVADPLSPLRGRWA
ncbi:MAG TPA: type VI secretion system contractile sheath large subunit [Terriglobia bacterium]|nr:type VI secretion system contractile sheath large subunit [Terriglobia bacterium]